MEPDAGILASRGALDDEPMRGEEFAEEAESPLARWPYDLRHAAVATWLSAGVDSTQVAAWAGHTVGS